MRDTLGRVDLDASVSDSWRSLRSWLKVTIGILLGTGWCKASFSSCSHTARYFRLLFVENIDFGSISGFCAGKSFVARPHLPSVWICMVGL